MGEPYRMSGKIATDFAHVYQDCFEARDSFLDTANQYLQKSGREPLLLERENSWQDVEASMVRACLALENMGEDDKSVKGFTQRLRQAYRTLCDNAGAISGLIDHIPKDLMLSSALRGGLKVIFLALEGSGYHRQAVHAAIEELPIILTDKTACIKIFVDDEELHRRMAALYIALLLTLRHLLKWFMKNPVRAAMKILVQPSGAEDRTKEKIALVKLRAEQFKERALICAHMRQNEALQLHQKTVELQEQSISLHGEELNMQKQVCQDVLDIKGDLDDIKTQLDRLACLREVVANFESSGPMILNPKPQSHRVGPVPKGPTASYVLSKLLYDPSIVRQDYQTLCNLHLNHSALDEDKILALVQNIRMRAWLATDESSVLLINGGTDSTSKSETSFVSALLVSSLSTAGESNSYVVSVSFFCGQHRKLSSDVYANPSEMMMCLLLQLIDNFNSFDTKDLGYCVENTDPGDINSICNVFEVLTRRLPRAIVLFIIIDGINFQVVSGQVKSTVRLSLILTINKAVKREFQSFDSAPHFSCVCWIS